MGKPVIVALLAGEAAYLAENVEEEQVVNRVMIALRKAHNNAQFL